MSWVLTSRRMPPHILVCSIGHLQAGTNNHGGHVLLALGQHPQLPIRAMAESGGCGIYRGCVLEHLHVQAGQQPTADSPPLLGPLGIVIPSDFDDCVSPLCKRKGRTALIGV
jgi:cytochrome c